MQVSRSEFRFRSKHWPDIQDKSHAVDTVQSFVHSPPQFVEAVAVVVELESLVDMATNLPDMVTDTDLAEAVAWADCGQRSAGVQTNMASASANDVPCASGRLPFRNTGVVAHGVQ